MNENFHNTDVQKDQLGCLRHGLRLNWLMKATCIS